MAGKVRRRCTHSDTLPLYDLATRLVSDAGRWTLSAGGLQLARLGERPRRSSSACRSELAMHGLAVAYLPRASSCRLGVQTLAAGHSGAETVSLFWLTTKKKRCEQHKEPLKGNVRGSGCAEQSSSDE